MAGSSRIPLLRKLIAGLALGVGSAAIVLTLGAAGWLERVEVLTYDWRTNALATPANVDPNIVLVEINDTTVRDLAPAFGRWPWPREGFAVLLDYLRRGSPAVVAVDFTFPEEQKGATFTFAGDTLTGEQSDADLVDSVRRAGNVILLADANYFGLVAGEQAQKPPDWQSPPYRLGAAIEERPIVVPSFQALTDAAWGLGHNFLPLDDGAARRVPPFIRVHDRYMPSLGVAAALKASGVRPEDVVLEDRTIRIRNHRIPLVPVRVRDAYDPQKSHDQLNMLIRYRAPALVNGNKPFKSYEARHLVLSEEQLREDQKPEVDPAEFKGKVVFVGQTISGLVDVFQTPVGRTMPGIQYHATVAQSILRGDFLAPASARSQIAATLGLAVLVGIMAAWLPFAGAAAGTLLAAAGWSWLALRTFDNGLWIGMASPLLGMAVALFGGTAYRYFVEDREKRKVKGLFGRYVSKDVYEQLLDNPALAQLGGRRREMTVLFSDIRGFTSVTEKGNPEELVAQLNEYFSKMVDVVFRHHGTVDKFVGDMVMALFGAPVDDVDHAEHAVAAAVDMVRELAELNRTWAAEGRACLDIGIGVNSGEMIAGNIGSSSIMSYTVIGDNVNLGSRLESLNKDYRTRIIISDATRTKLKGTYDLRPLGEAVVKGKTRPVAIFEVIVPSPIPVPNEEVSI
jgi:adenylate cyclase